MARPDRFIPPPGCVVVRIEDLAALVAAVRAPGSATSDRARSGGAAAPGTGWDALAATVALLTARLDNDASVSAASLAPDVAPSDITAVAVTIAAAWLRVSLPDRGGALLRDLGLLAAARGETPEALDGDGPAGT